MLQRIKARKSRYIKLGEKAEWEKLCFQDGTLRLGFYEAPHEYGLAGDRNAIAEIYRSWGRNRATATSYANQVGAFYDEPEDTLWITFANGYLYWCQACTDVEFLGQDKPAFPTGSRLRRTKAGWHNTDIAGRALAIPDITGKLLVTSAYRSTICLIKDHQRLVALINGETGATRDQALAARAAAIDILKTMITDLHWKDFEVLVELIFAQSGWRRLGGTGGTQKTVDIELELPITGERAFVQVKARTSPAQLSEYIDRMSAHHARRMFFVYHTCEIPLATSRPDVTILDIEALAEKAFSAGLFDWLINKAR